MSPVRQSVAAHHGVSWRTPGAGSTLLTAKHPMRVKVGNNSFASLNVHGRHALRMIQSLVIAPFFERSLAVAAKCLTVKWAPADDIRIR